MKTTTEQRKALKRIYCRMLQWDNPTTLTYLQFRRTVHQGWDCLMVPYGSMWLGIEKDGYTHS